MRKLGIIGLGNVGALLANLLVARQIVDELVLIDTNSDLAVGLQNDLLDGMSALAVQPTIKVQDYVEESKEYDFIFRRLCGKIS